MAVLSVSLNRILIRFILFENLMKIYGDEGHELA